ncbi:hypothetical protein [Longibacter salinarum]|nr:hypothetical protein [Longibacter salinarum]
MFTSSRLSRLLNGVLTICLLVLFAACGSAGGNEPPEDDDTFPEPPSRPSSVQVDSTGASQ